MSCLLVRVMSAGLSIMQIRWVAISGVMFAILLFASCSCGIAKKGHQEDKDYTTFVVENDVEKDFEVGLPQTALANEIIIRRKAYTVSYNKETKCPNWVMWRLTAEHSDGPVNRSYFYEDNDVPAPRATLADYRCSGWSRGHMCPAGDNKWDRQAMNETFSLVNICPQDERLNSGLWNSIEMDCRKWARRFGDVYIVCGPLFYRQEHTTIGSNKVYVPEAFFKVVLCLTGMPKGMGFVVKNNAGTKKRDLYYNSIDQVERITGIDFFPLLPNDLEEEIESSLDMDLWR